MYINEGLEGLGIGEGDKNPSSYEFGGYISCSTIDKKGGNIKRERRGPGDRWRGWG